MVSSCETKSLVEEALAVAVKLAITTILLILC